MAPTASFSALSVGILVALEPLKYVVAFGIAGLAGQTRGVVRAGTAATDEHDERLGINLLLELCQEMAIRLIGRIVQPFDFLGTGNATHPVPLGTGSHVDDFGSGRQLPDFMGLLRRQCASIGSLSSRARVRARFSRSVSFPISIEAIQIRETKYKSLDLPLAASARIMLLHQCGALVSIYALVLRIAHVLNVQNASSC